MVMEQYWKVMVIIATRPPANYSVVGCHTARGGSWLWKPASFNPRLAGAGCLAGNGAPSRPQQLLAGNAPVSFAHPRGCLAMQQAQRRRWASTSRMATTSQTASTRSQSGVGICRGGYSLQNSARSSPPACVMHEYIEAVVSGKAWYLAPVILCKSMRTGRQPAAGGRRQLWGSSAVDLVHIATLYSVPRTKFAATTEIGDGL
jgi:hypothetical protein